jgi:cell division protein ZapA (FtsZ GTPase activity inhibitor)
MVIEIPIGKSRYKINCEETEKEKFLHLANRLNQRINELSLQTKLADEKTLLVLSALMIEDELENKNDCENREELEQSTFDAMSDNMENIADYIEKLTKKIENF